MQPIEIDFVNHSSVIVTHGDVRLISDPWLEGNAFNAGWALLSPTAFEYDDFRTITHIWFSHEHPDHFSPPCLQKIPEDARRNITVLFQKTDDTKVVNYCRRLNFKEVTELEPGRPHPLAPGFEVLCGRWPGFEDSWLLMDTAAGRVLNVNDCPIKTRVQAQNLKRQVGQVDVLLTQFSISSWDGNEEELERRRAGAREMLNRNIMQTEILGPKVVIPFASFIWFCHEENFYMNEGFLPIQEVYETLRDRTGVEVLMMYPGDTWTVGQPVDCGEAVRRYAADQASLASRPRVQPQPRSEDELTAAGERFRQKLVEGSDPFRLRMRFARLQFRRALVGSAWAPLTALFDLARLKIAPARVFVSDLGQAYTFGLRSGLHASTLGRQDCDVEMSSDSLFYAFTHLWGGTALYINGRFHELRPEARGNLFDYFYFAVSRNAGQTVSWNLPLLKSTSRA